MKNKVYKKIVVLSTLLICVLFITSCKEDYLDTSPVDYINYKDFVESSKKNTELLSAPLKGLYLNMIKKGTGGTSSDTDFGQKSYDIISDILCSDMAYTRNSYSSFSNTANYKFTIDYTKIENYKAWRYYYRLIYGANVFINSLENQGGKFKTQAQNYAMGQALAIRAYSYFYLTQFYIKEYTPNSKILPLYLKPKDGFAKGASSTKEIYDQMIKDLNESIFLLKGFKRSAKNIINQDVAKGLLAYVYGAMNTANANEEAKKLTSEIILSGKYPIMTSKEVLGGFNDVNTPGWMWAFDLTKNLGYGLATWWGHVDTFTYSYQNGDQKSIDDVLYSKISDKDIRKKQFKYEKDSVKRSKDAYNLIPYNKFYDPNRVVDGARIVTNDYVFMRISEIYLLNAEMAAKTGDEAMAKKSLKTLLEKRFKNKNDFSYVDALSGKALLDEIYLQTRIELWGEGKSYLAMKRFKSKITRGENHLYFKDLSIDYNDDRLTFLIPQSEIQNNFFIKDK